VRSAEGAQHPAPSTSHSDRTPHSAPRTDPGIRPASDERMNVRSHRDLQAWQLADGVRRRMFELLANPAVAKDFQFRDQAQSAANSSCRNLAEGFYRYRHKEFAHFVNISRASLGELLDSLDEARIKKYLTPDAHASFDAQIREAMRVANGLYRYLRDNPDPE
jgi:four helix bundle protein